MARRPKRLRSRRRPRLSIPEILAWADEHFAANGNWPTIRSGSIVGTIDDTWLAIDAALRQGIRGLPPGSNLSLARLLEEHRGVRNAKHPPKLSATKIAKWAKNHRLVHGDWPHAEPEAIDDAPGETWLAIDMALRNGRRGLPGGSSLARFLSDRFGVRNHLDLPPLTEAQILAWADAHFRRWGRRPWQKSGPIAQTNGETWYGVNKALVKGTRTLRGGQSLVQLLDRLRPHMRRRRNKQTIG